MRSDEKCTRIVCIIACGSGSTKYLLSVLSLGSSVLGEDHLEGYPRGLHRRRLATVAHHRRRAATLRRRPTPHHGRSAPYGRRLSPCRRHPARPPPSHHFILPADLINVGVSPHTASHLRRRLAHAPVPSPPGPPSSPQTCSSEDGRVFDGTRMSASSRPREWQCLSPTVSSPLVADVRLLICAFSLSYLLMNTSRMATESICASLCLYSRTICLLLFRVLHVVGTLETHPSRPRSLDYVDAAVSAGDISRPACPCIFVPVEFSS